MQSYREKKVSIEAVIKQLLALCESSYTLDPERYDLFKAFGFFVQEKDKALYTNFLLKIQYEDPSL